MGVYNGIRANPKIEITDDQKKYILENYEKYTSAQMATYLKVSGGKMQSWLRELEIKKPRVRQKIELESEFFDYNKMYL